MTNTEAITKLTNIMHDDLYSWHPSILEAFRMAVDALKGAEGDCISRQAAIDALHMHLMYRLGTDSNKKRLDDWINSLPSAQPEQHGRVFKGIVVEYLTYSTYPEYEGKPYFSIKYTENGQEFIGYGTYKPEVLSEFLKEYFISSAQPEQRWITSGKPMNSGMYLVTLRQKFEGEEAYGVRIMRFINGNWMLPKHFPEWINEEIEQEVLAWRELPEPWKEGEADG